MDSLRYEPEIPLQSTVRLDLLPEPGSLTPPGDRHPPIDAGLGEDVDLVESEAGKLGGCLRYNRVEGFFLEGNFRRALDRRSFLPAYEVALGYGFSAERGQYRVGFEQPVLARNKLSFGVEAYRRNLTFFYSDENLTGGENTASALFLHRDYWDLHEAEGFRGFLTVRPSPLFTLQPGILVQDETALTNRTDWSLFRQTDDFPANPAAETGEYRGLDLTLAYDSRPRDEEGKLSSRPRWGGLQHWHRLTWERGDAGMGGDFDLWRIYADLRSYLRLSARQNLTARLLAASGSAGGDPLPPQRRFHLGGLGTMRGQFFRSLAGNRALLLNAEYAFLLGGRIQALFFSDIGNAFDHGTLFEQRILVDLGTGLRLGTEDGVTLLVARNLNESDAEVKVHVRLVESF
jgi:outer membrane protein assembly factor BamA